MNFGTQKRYENHIGMQISQIVSRDNRVVLGNASENLNRFLFSHSRKNVGQKSRKFRLNEYFTKDLRAKTSTTHHFLCGPLNTKRLTRKTIGGNFDDESTTQSLNVSDLYSNSKQISNKPPWIEQSEPGTFPEHHENKKMRKPEVRVSFESNPRFGGNFANSTKRSDDEQELQDGQVPDPMHKDLKDSCPLYDSNEYEQCPRPIDDQKQTSDDEISEPDVSRYNFFVGASEMLSNGDTYASRSIDSRNDRMNNNVIRRKSLPREKLFVPLLTSSQDFDFSTAE